MLKFYIYSGKSYYSDMYFQRVDNENGMPN